MALPSGNANLRGFHPRWDVHPWVTFQSGVWEQPQTAHFPPQNSLEKPPPRETPGETQRPLPQDGGVGAGSSGGQISAGSRVDCSGFFLPSPPFPISVSYPDVLQCVTVTIFSTAECKRLYPGSITENMICAGSLQGGRDSCQVRPRCPPSTAATRGCPQGRPRGHIPRSPPWGWWSSRWLMNPTRVGQHELGKAAMFSTQQGLAKTFRKGWPKSVQPVGCWTNQRQLDKAGSSSGHGVLQPNKDWSKQE